MSLMLHIYQPFKLISQVIFKMVQSSLIIIRWLIKWLYKLVVHFLGKSILEVEEIFAHKSC